MKTLVVDRGRPTLVLALALAPAAAWAQDAPEEAEAVVESGDAQVPVAAETGGADTYKPEDFARFAPRNALDMLRQVPGFTIVEPDQGRGLGQATVNVLLNGERLTSKSDSIEDQLSRIPAGRVVRIDIADGASFGIPGLAGQVANVITQGGGISGRFEYRAVARPKYAKPSYGGGEISVSGSSDSLEWTAAFSHGTGRGGAGGGEGAYIYDGTGNLLEHRDVLIRFVGEFPELSGRLKWTSPSGLIANFNVSYGRDYTKSTNDEDREVFGGVDLFRDFTNNDDRYDYEIGGDVDFALGPGRLKLIGLERFDHGGGPATSILIYDDGRPSTGSRYADDRNSGERIGRAEYRWDMLGGNWQLDGEAAFNRYDQTATLSILQPDGEFAPIPFPGANGRVTEDRYETILTHNRTLGKGLTLQLGAGGEYSKLVARSGANELSRTFLRPKGSLTLAWTPEPGLDLSLKFARTVGQLSFGDFLAGINLAQENEDAGNIKLVPQQAWEADFEIKKNLKAWGSANLKLYSRWIEDYIDIVPVGDGFESRGNIDSARLYGASLNATINFDPLGWKGAKLDLNAAVEDSNLEDPLTFEDRPFSYHEDWEGEASLRYDIPGSDWALGGGFNWTHVQPYVRLFEVGKDYEGPIYTFAFIENKDVFGLTVNLNMFNLTGGEGIFYRTVYDGLRDRSPVLFVEDRKLNVSTIYRISVKGSF